MPLRPFHETVVDAIRRCPGPSSGEILCLFQMMKETKIPEGHDEVIAAIDEYFNFPGGEKWARDIRLVKENLLAQKQEVKHEEVNLDELQRETEKLLDLLKNRRDSSNVMWHLGMTQQMMNLHALSSRALGK